MQQPLSIIRDHQPQTTKATIISLKMPFWHFSIARQQEMNITEEPREKKELKQQREKLCWKVSGKEQKGRWYNFFSFCSLKKEITMQIKFVYNIKNKDQNKLFNNANGEIVESRQRAQAHPVFL